MTTKLTPTDAVILTLIFAVIVGIIFTGLAAFIPRGRGRG